MPLCLYVLKLLHVRYWNPLDETKWNYWLLQRWFLQHFWHDFILHFRSLFLLENFRSIANARWKHWWFKWRSSYRFTDDYNNVQYFHFDTYCCQNLLLLESNPIVWTLSSACDSSFVWCQEFLPLHVHLDFCFRYLHQSSWIRKQFRSWRYWIPRNHCRFPNLDIDLGRFYW